MNHGPGTRSNFYHCHQPLKALMKKFPAETASGMRSTVHEYAGFRRALLAHTPGVPSDIPPLPPEREPDIILPPDSRPTTPEELPPRVPPVPQQDPPGTPQPLR